MIKKLHFIFALFAAYSLAAQTPIPNGNFEQWDSVIYQNPTGYATSNFGTGNLPPGAPGNVTQVAGYHAKYGVQLTTIVVGKDTGFAYIANSQNNPVQGKGGIPYNQQAKGFRIYYKCNVMAKDTAGIMFVFKKAGSVIGTYYVPVMGTVSSYTLLSKTFSPALAQAPDSVIFAATSSDVIFGGNGKAGSTLTIDSLTFTGVSSQPAMLNGDFENWMFDTLYTPHSWLVSTVGNARTTDKYAGKYALALTTGLPPGNNSIQGGFATDGTLLKINNNNDSTVGGYPYSRSADSIYLYYKYVPGFVGDTAAVQMQFSKNSQVVGYVGVKLPPAPTYTRIVAPFFIGTTPDSVITFITSSINNNPSKGGSMLKVDSLCFYSQIIAGIAPITSSGNIKVYPNPVKDIFYVDLKDYSGKVNTIKIYDMSGKVIETRNYNFSPLMHTVESFDMSAYSAGTYLMSIGTPSGVKYQKVSKVN